MHVRTKYDPISKSFKSTTTEVKIMQGTSGSIRYHESNFMNGSPFGPFDPDQPFNGTPCKKQVNLSLVD